MHVLFESNHPEGPQLRGLVERRLRFVMRRLSWLVPRARVCLSDLNGPRGGVDKQCRVELKADVGPRIVVSAAARDWRSALDLALARASRTLVRSWQRTRKPGRPARDPHRL